MLKGKGHVDPAIYEFPLTYDAFGGTDPGSADSPKFFEKVLSPARRPPSAILLSHLPKKPKNPGKPNEPGEPNVPDITLQIWPWPQQSHCKAQLVPVSDLATLDAGASQGAWALLSF